MAIKCQHNLKDILENICLTWKKAGEEQEIHDTNGKQIAKE